MVDDKWRHFDSSDPLDLGEALWLAHWALHTSPESREWAEHVSRWSLGRLEWLGADGYFNQASGYRLAFRELGTSLGVQVNPFASRQEKMWTEQVESVHDFWAPRVMDRDRDITPVMMASSLVPGVWSGAYEGKLRATCKVIQEKSREA